MSFGQRVPANDDTGFKQFAPRAGLIQLPNEDGSHVYTIPPLSYELGLELRAWQEKVNEVNAVIQRNLNAAMEAKKKGEEAPEPEPVPDYEFPSDEGPTPENMLGSALDEMRANGESHDFVQAATRVVYLDFLYDRETAEQFWNTGADPKATAYRLYGSGIDHGLSQDEDQETTSTSTTTGEANTTKKPASTSGTNSRKKSNKKSTTTTKNTQTKNGSQSSASKKS